MSPAETPHGTWDIRMQSKSFTNGVACTRCTNCEPDLDYIALLKREIAELRKVKAQFGYEVNVSTTTRKTKSVAFQFQLNPD